jgi:hypothetical protein
LIRRCAPGKNSRPFSVLWVEPSPSEICEGSWEFCNAPDGQEIDNEKEQLTEKREDSGKDKHFWSLNLK